jgi:hypothetical protein
VAIDTLKRLKPSLMSQTPCRKATAWRTCSRSAWRAGPPISPSFRSIAAPPREIPRRTSVSLFDQGLLQVLQVAVTGLQPKQPYVLALSRQADGGGDLEPLSAFTTNPAGSAIVNAVGPFRQVVGGEAQIQRRYLVIVSGNPSQLGPAVQIQAR